MDTMINIIKKMRRKYYGASKAVFRLCDTEKILEMKSDWHYLLELHTRCVLIGVNSETKKGVLIPHFNNKLKVFKQKYPNVWEFQHMKPERL